MADNDKTSDTAPKSAPESDAESKKAPTEALVTPAPKKDLPPEKGSREKPVTPAKSGVTTSPGTTKGRAFVSGLLVSAVILVGALGAAFVYRDTLVQFIAPEAFREASGDADRIAALEAKLAALEATDRTLADTLANRDNELTALSNTIGQLETGSSAADLDTAKSMISALEERLDSFEAQTGERDPMVQGTEPEGTNPGQQAQTAGQVTEMKDALNTLSDRFAKMNESLEAAGGRIEALEETAPPENLGEILQNLSPRNEIGALNARLAAIEDADPEGAARAAVMALAATELARAAATSLPFTTELEAFAALAPGKAQVTDLRVFAEAGAATEKTLLLAFETTAHAISEAERLREGGGVWNWIVNKITALFSIRKVGERDGNDWQSILARAENRIAVEDLAAAAQELSKLEGSAAKGAAPWLERFEARQSVDGLVTSLTAEVFADLLLALESE